MKKLLLATALCALAAPAYAQTAAAPPAAAVDDPLHLCYATGRSAFGGVTISTLGGSGATGWGVSSSPAAQSGDLYLALLVPNNEMETKALPGRSPARSTAIRCRRAGLSMKGRSAQGKT